MTKRFALLYADGSISVLNADKDLEQARKEFLASSDDDDTRIVEVDIKIVASHGTPKLQIIKAKCVTCPTCQDTIYFDEDNTTPPNNAGETK
jgi:hypothetical protein